MIYVFADKFKQERIEYDFSNEEYVYTFPCPTPMSKYKILNL